MSMYADYIKELKGDGIVEKEEGFATYRFITENGVPSIYIIDIFTHPDFRRTGFACDVADEIVEIGKKNGCKRLIGTVVPSNKGSTESLKLLLNYDMKLYSSGNDFIVFHKEI